MTSEQIKNKIADGVNSSNAPKWEIAFQLAVMNERKEKELYDKGWNDGLEYFIQNVLRPAQEHGIDGLRRAIENLNNRSL